MIIQSGWDYCRSDNCCGEPYIMVTLCRSRALAIYNANWVSRWDNRGRSRFEKSAGLFQSMINTSNVWKRKRARASPRWKMQIAFRDMGYNSGTLASEVKVSRDIVHTLSEEPSCGILSYSVLRCWCTFIKTCEYDYVWMRLLRGDISILFEE